MNRKKILTIGLIIFAVLGIAGTVAWHFMKPGAPPAAAETATAAGCKKVLYWTDPMIPGFKSDKPGKSPMNMDMIPVCADDQPPAASAVGAPVISIDPQVMQNFGVRTYQVTGARVPRILRAHGYLFRDRGGMMALVDIVDRDAVWVHPGLDAVVRVDGLPGREWQGTVERVAPDIDVGALSLRAHVRITRPRLLLPNMFAEVVIQGPPPHGAGLFIPREALIRTGNRNTVILALGQGRFQPTEVVPGIESGGDVEIRKGIKVGDTVVVSGQFLIDSEASVRASFERMDTPAADAGIGQAEHKP